MAEFDVEPDPAQLRELLKEFNTFDRRVKTPTRRALRGTGDNIIAEQRAILDGPLPRGVEVTGTVLRVVVNKRTNKIYTRKLNVYGEKDVANGGRSSGLRERIKAGLVTRVVTGISRQSIEIKTQNSKAPMSTGWNAKRFRHPVFGNKERFVYQAGQPYFFDPIFRGRKQMIADAIDILNNAVEGR